MDQRIYHGKLTPKDMAQALMGEFNRGNLRAQVFGNEKDLVVQIVTKEWLQSGGQTALSVSLKQVEDGVAIGIGKQAWLGVAASLGQTLFSAWRNPWNLLNRLDDLAQDIQSMQLSEDVVNVIEKTARSVNASYELSERLRRLTCEYCGSANPVGASNCLACGAPMGKLQPRTCTQCGFVIKTTESQCPNCGHQLSIIIPTAITR
jgi:DNA-directed RNA polymerase subunit RPC12/RpoP